MLHPFKYLFSAAIFFAASRADCQEYYDKARDAASSARISSIGASGAAQVSQVHSQAQTEIQATLVKQGDNNLKMAERIEGELKTLRKETADSRVQTLSSLETLRKETADSRVQTLSSLETLRKETADNRVQTLSSLETLRKETADSKIQLLAMLESYRKETGTLVKYLGISLAVGLVAILAVLGAIYVQLRKTATRDSGDKIADNIRSSG